jgi:hypothetical protein
MDGCNRIKRIIDEADRPDALAYAASQHMASCAACSAFADERARLKELLAGAGRVSAPPDFDIKLKARLIQVKEQKSSWWIIPSSYLKLGAATAALVIAVVAAQTTDFFSGREQAQPTGNALAIAPPSDPAGVIDTPAPRLPDNPEVVTLPRNSDSSHFISRNSRRQVRSAAPVRGFIAEDGTMVLMRGPAGELEVPVPTVSVGAQSLLYVNSGRQSARNISTSF